MVNCCEAETPLVDPLISWPVGRIRRPEGRRARARGSAKVQIGAELRCKSAKVNDGQSWSMQPSVIDPAIDSVICVAYFFAAFGFALERFTLRTDRRVARGLTGFLAR